MANWDHDRRNEQDISKYFSSIGPVKNVEPWCANSIFHTKELFQKFTKPQPNRPDRHSANLVRVCFKDESSVGRAITLLDGARPNGSQLSLEVRAVDTRRCARCELLQAELDRLRGAHRAPPPPRRHFEEQRKRPRPADENDFVAIVREKLGDGAANHVTERLPKHVKDQVGDRGQGTCCPL